MAACCRDFIFEANKNGGEEREKKRVKKNTYAVYDPDLSLFVLVGTRYAVGSTLAAYVYTRVLLTAV